MEEMNIFFMVIFLIVLLGFSAFFSGSETALMAITRLRLKHLAKTKPRRARLVERVLEKPERLIGTILLGNNLVNVAISAIATAVAISIWGDRGIVYATGVLTLVILIFAEITPKVYAKYFNERVSFVTAPILNVIMVLFDPIVRVVTFTSKKLLFIIGVDVSKMKRLLMSEEEIHTCIQMGWDDGAITAEESKMLSRVFRLDDKTVGQVMVPKEKMIMLDSEASAEEIYRIILDTGHTRFPVRKGRDEEIIGFIHAKDLFHFMDQKKTGSIKDFQNKRLHQAVVLDSEGEVTGLITLEDILEELVGSIQDEHD
jgi:Mg2+/Co2+ transporter CorB